MDDDSIPVATGSVLTGLEEFPWSDDESRSFEAALNGASMLIAEYTALIAAEAHKAAPDRQALAAWQGEQRQWIARRRSLQRGDHSAVTAVTRECAAALVRLTGQTT